MGLIAGRRRAERQGLRPGRELTVGILTWFIHSPQPWWGGPLAPFLHTGQWGYSRGGVHIFRAVVLTVPGSKFHSLSNRHDL